MQIVALGDNLHKISKLIFWENKKNINLLSAEFAHRVVKVKSILVNIPTQYHTAIHQHILQ